MRAKSFTALNLPSLNLNKTSTDKPQEQISDLSVNNYFSSFPSEESIQKSFGDAYVINQPMNGVGGDGYWKGVKGNLSYLVVFDCMGHGRFAAMMTRFYTRIIYDVIVNNDLYNPADILLKIHHRVKEEYKDQDAKYIGTGADMGILVLDRKHRKMTYAGAAMDLVTSSPKGIDRIKGDKRQIGHYFEHERTYTTHTLNLKKNKGFKYYLFSDGVTDLFGGPKGKKLNFKNLAKIIESAYQDSLMDEKVSIEKTLNSWAGSNDPLDDLLLIGLSVA